MTDPSWLERVIEWYERDTGTLVGEVVLGVSLTELQVRWDAPSNDPMFEMYAVTEQQRDFVEEVLGWTLEQERFAYYLTAHCTDFEAQQAADGFMGRFAAPRVLPAFPDAARVAPKT